MKNKVFFIAEISANHCGNFELAKKLIKIAAESGADIIKLQMRDIATLYGSEKFKDIEEINKKVMTKKMQDDKLSSKNTLGDANEQLQELKDKMDGK